MKTIARIVGGLMIMMISIISFGQTIDDQRMERDIQVVENVLSTLLRQQFDKQRLFFPLEVKGSYQPGYGVTFRLPADFTTPIVFSFDRSFEGSGDGNLVWDAPAPPDAPQPPGTFSYTYRIESDDEFIQEDGEMIENRIDGGDKREKKIKIQKEEKNAVVLKEKATKDKERKIKERKIALDSVRDSYNEKVITASKDFLADYGDLLSQLAPGEKIVITNQGEQPRMWVGKLMNAPARTHLSIEMLKGDITQYKQGKLTRDQLIAKIKVVDTETVEAVEPDIELLSSIFDRLYQADLARTFFTEDRIYFERLKDYGVVYYMQVFSSNQQDYDLFSMPTLKLRNLDLETRNKKVTELYPEFEKELKENIIEYGRTVKSLKDTEVLVFNVKVTKCPACGIPSSLEVSVQGSVLKEYSAGKIDKATTLSKLSIKKGANQ